MSASDLTRIEELEKRCRAYQAQLAALTAERDELNRRLSDEEEKNRDLQTSLTLHAAPDKVTLAASYVNDLYREFQLDDTDGLDVLMEAMKQRAEAAEAARDTLLSELDSATERGCSMNCDAHSSCLCVAHRMRERVLTGLSAALQRHGVIKETV